MVRQFFSISRTDSHALGLDAFYHPLTFNSFMRSHPPPGPPNSCKVHWIKRDHDARNALMAGRSMAGVGDLNCPVSSPTPAVSGSDCAEPEGNQVSSVRGMDLMGEQITASGLPQDTTAFIALSIRRSSQSTYESVWRSRAA